MKKTSNKAKVIYKIITAITLFVPLPVYLFLMATLFSITPDYTVFTKVENVVIGEYAEGEESIYFLSTTDNASMNGLLVFRDGRYGIEIEETDIIKIDKKYYSYVLDKETNVRELKDIKKLAIQKEQSYKIPISFFISVFGVLVVVLIVQGKMQWHKTHPRVAALIGLLTGTVILLIINAIVSNILGVFIVATASWAIYCLEYMLNENLISTKDKEKQESSILAALKEAMK